MTDKQKIAHYIKHGDKDCRTCQQGFRLYWHKKKVNPGKWQKPMKEDT